MAVNRNASDKTRIAVCPAFRPPESSTGRQGCGQRFDGDVRSARPDHFAEHDPEDFGLTPLQSDDRAPRAPVGGD